MENGDDTPPDSSKSTPRPRRRKPRKSVEIIEEDGESGDTSVTVKKRPKRGRTTSGSGDTEDGDEDGSTTPKRRRRRRKSNVPTPPPYDPTADPGEEIDPTAVKMAALCDDLGTGRVSSKAAQILTNHATWRAANKAKRERMKAIMEAKKYGRNLEEEEENEAQREKESSAAPDAVPAVTSGTDEAGPSGGEIEDLGINKQDNFDYTQNMRTSRYTTQVRIGPNGEMIVDEQSLFVDRPDEDDTAGYTHVEESDTSKFVNSATYSRKMRGSRWSAEETELFYDVSATLSHQTVFSTTFIGTLTIRRELRTHILRSPRTRSQSLQKQVQSRRQTRSCASDILSDSSQTLRSVYVIVSTFADISHIMIVGFSRCANLVSYDREGFLRTDT